MFSKASDLKKIIAPAILFLFLFMNQGCAQFNKKGTGGEQLNGGEMAPSVPANAPYYPTEFKDLLIPGELKMNTDKTLSIRTDSYAGGIFVFAGRVEINSLSDFFISTMKKSGWKLRGTIKHKDIMLAFIKPYKSCMLKIGKSDFGISTEVLVYITEDLAAQSTLQ